MSKRTDYVTNQQLMPEMLKYKETGLMSEELGEMVLMMCFKIMLKSNFNKYTFKAEMIGEAIENIMKYLLNNFDPYHEKANPFGYLTTMIHNSFKNCIKKQQKHSKIKDLLYNSRLYLFESTSYSLKGIDYTELKKEL